MKTLILRACCFCENLPQPSFSAGLYWRKPFQKYMPRIAMDIIKLLRRLKSLMDDRGRTLAVVERPKPFLRPMQSIITVHHIPHGLSALSPPGRPRADGMED